MSMTYTEARVNEPNITVNLPNTMLTPAHEDQLCRLMGRPTGPPPMQRTEELIDGTPTQVMLMPDTFDKYQGNDWSRDTMKVSAMSMLAMRMKWGPFSSLGANDFAPFMPREFDHMTIHRGEHKTIIMVIKNGSPVILEDPTELFPSDTLVGQMILLQQGNPTGSST